MNIYRSTLPDVWIIEPKIHGDARGYFVETFRADLFRAATGLSIHFVQDNESKSNYGVLRGLHYQLPPRAQSKLVRVIDGRVLDVAVDIRRDSPTFGQHVALELSGDNKRQLFIPRGFAHAFVVLSDYAVFAYKVDDYYAPECDRGIAFDDPQLAIDWSLPSEALQLSAKDRQWRGLRESEVFASGEGLYD